MLRNFFCKVGAKKAVPLADHEVREFLATENQQVVNSLYSVVLGLYSNEGDRTKSLDSKAAALFGFVGILLSAIFIVLGFLADSKNVKLADSLAGWSLYVVIVVLGLLGFALLALFLAVVVKNGWKAPGDRDLFEAIHKYDGHGRLPENQIKTDHDYKRHLIDHFWQLYRACFNQNEAKAKALFYGQLLIFLSLVLLIGVQIKTILTFEVNMNKSNQNSPISSALAVSANPVAPTAIEKSAAPEVPKGAPVSERGARPAPLEASSAGRNVRFSEGSEPLRPSESGHSTGNKEEK